MNNKLKDINHCIGENYFNLYLILGIILIIFFVLVNKHIGSVSRNDVYVSEPEIVNQFNLSIKIMGIGNDSIISQIPINVTIRESNSDNIVFDQVVIFYKKYQNVFVSEQLSGNFWDRSKMFDLLIKGPKHKQIKFLNVSVIDGNIDLTKIALPVGDLPAQGYQDKVIDLNDYQNLISRIGSSETVDLSISDLDFNGVINSRDRSLFLKSLDK